MLSGITNDGKRIDEWTHMGAESMRIRLEVIRTLQLIKTGSNSKTNSIHVSPEHMDKLINYVQDYAIIQRWKSNKKYRGVFNDPYEDLSTGHG